MNVSQYDIQSYSSVYETLKNEPLSSTFYDPDIKTAKENTLLAFWGRPTIMWDLNCNASRTTAYDLINEG